MKGKKKLQFIYGILLSLLIIASGIALILSCLSIYNSGPRPYNPQSIGVHFQAIALLIYLTLVAIVGGIQWFMPIHKVKPKAIKNDCTPLKLQLKKSGELLGQFRELSQKEVTYRRTTRIICINGLFTGGVPLTRGSRFCLTGGRSFSPITATGRHHTANGSDYSKYKKQRKKFLQSIHLFLPNFCSKKLQIFDYLCFICENTPI